MGVSKIANFALFIRAERDDASWEYRIATPAIRRGVGNAEALFQRERQVRNNHEAGSRGNPLEGDVEMGEAPFDDRLSGGGSAAGPPSDAPVDEQMRLTSDGAVEDAPFAPYPENEWGTRPLTEAQILSLEQEARRLRAIDDLGVRSTQGFPRGDFFREGNWERADAFNEHHIGVGHTGGQAPPGTMPRGLRTAKEEGHANKLPLGLRSGLNGESLQQDLSAFDMRPRQPSSADESLVLELDLGRGVATVLLGAALEVLTCLPF